MFVADMNRIYDDCMEHYKQYKDAFFYSWAKYSKDKLEKIVDKFLNEEPPFPGENKNMQSGDIMYKKMLDCLLQCCKYALHLR